MIVEAAVVEVMALAEVVEAINKGEIYVLSL